MASANLSQAAVGQDWMDGPERRWEAKRGVGGSIDDVTGQSWRSAKAIIERQ